MVNLIKEKKNKYLNKIFFVLLLIPISFLSKAISQINKFENNIISNESWTTTSPPPSSKESTNNSEKTSKRLEKNSTGEDLQNIDRFLASDETMDRAPQEEAQREKSRKRIYPGGRDEEPLKVQSELFKPQRKVLPEMQVFAPEAEEDIDHD